MDLISNAHRSAMILTSTITAIGILVVTGLNLYTDGNFCRYFNDLSYQERVEEVITNRRNYENEMIAYHGYKDRIFYLYGDWENDGKELFK